MSDVKKNKGGVLFVGEDGTMTGHLNYNGIEYKLESNGEVFTSEKEDSAKKPYKKIVLTNPASPDENPLSGILFHQANDNQDGKIGIVILFGDQETAGTFTSTKPKDFKNPAGERIPTKPYYRLKQPELKGAWKTKREEENVNPF